jgi:hypothetical protein
MKLVLNQSGLSLGFTVNETGWCKLQLFGNGVTHHLGAESLNVLKRRLISALSEPVVSSRSTLMRNIAVVCVLNLHVKPWSLYLGSSGDRRHLFFRNREEGLVIELVLSQLDCRRWCEALTELSSDALEPEAACAPDIASQAAE